MPEPDKNQTAMVQRLFVQHLVPLRGFLLGLTGDFHRVDDLVQETFLTALEKAADFEEGGNFRAWIFAIGRFKVLSFLRDAGREPLLFESDVVERLADAAPDFSANDERMRHLQACIEKLAPHSRRAKKRPSRPREGAAAPSPRLKSAAANAMLSERLRPANWAAAWRIKSPRN